MRFQNAQNAMAMATSTNSPAQVEFSTGARSATGDTTASLALNYVAQDYLMSKSDSSTICFTTMAGR